MWKTKDVVPLAVKIKRLRNVRLVLDDQLYDKVYDNITEAMEPRIIAARRRGVDF